MGLEAQGPLTNPPPSPPPNFWEEGMKKKGEEEKEKGEELPLHLLSGFATVHDMDPFTLHMKLFGSTWSQLLV